MNEISDEERAAAIHRIVQVVEDNKAEGTASYFVRQVPTDLDYQRDWYAVAAVNALTIDGWRPVPSISREELAAPTRTAVHEHFTDAEWAAYQSIPDQGYSHRHWLNCHIDKVLRTDVASTLTRKELAMAYWTTQGYDSASFDVPDGNTDRRLAYNFADAVLAALYPSAETGDTK